MAHTMTMEFAFSAAAAGTEFRLLEGSVARPVDSWAVHAPAALLPGVDLLNRLIAEDRALAKRYQDTLAPEDISSAFEAHGQSIDFDKPLCDAVLPLERVGIGGNGSTASAVLSGRSAQLISE